MRGKTISVLTVVLALSLGVGFPKETSAGVKNIKKCTTITESGSYLVKKNLAGTGNCIVIQADFVTLDLNGFTITGDGTGGGITDGGTGRKGIAIYNGVVTGFVNGIALGDSTEVSVERVRAFSNTERGIKVGRSSIVKDSLAADNGSDGIFADFGSTVADNTARNNGTDGIDTNSGSTVTGNTARDNTHRGLEIDCPSNVIGNTATNKGTNLALNGGDCNSSNNLAP